MFELHCISILDILYVNNVWSMSHLLSSFFLSGHLNKPQFRTSKLEIGLTRILVERSTSWAWICMCLFTDKGLSLHRQSSAEVLCLYHGVSVLISLKHKNFGQVTKMNMQGRHWRVVTFMDVIYPWCLQEVKLHL